MKDAKGHGSDAHGAGVAQVGQPIPVAAKVAGVIQRNPNGFSVTPSGQVPTNGFMVSVPGRTRFLNPGEVTPQHVAEFANQHADLFRDNPNMHVGMWHDPATERVHLDPSENFKSRSSAETAGKSRNQIAIWDVQNRRSIPTGGTGG